MFRSLSVLMFNTSQIETNLFGMADDVYNTIEIFKEAASFEARIGRPYRMISSLIDCLVFMVVALMVVGFIMHDRIMLFTKLARINQRINQEVTVKSKRIRKSKTSDSLPEEDDTVNAVDQSEEDGISVANSEYATDDDIATLQPIDDEDTSKAAMLGTPKWAFKWLATIRNKSFGSIYDGWFR
ncbi:uncharacterized protein LOC116801799 [Drosophila sechellia]|uniref:uncharacterized protein LOC116801799 n=1 Tax=Drosophila sechellia TaxID=7238 RepID=UPI0013DE47CE|nr:uncharacterized protein LOC116801799 [Drosophila sechellia]